MRYTCQIICTCLLLLTAYSANAQRKITGSEDLRVNGIKDTGLINNTKLLYTLVNPIRCMIDVNGISSASTGLFDLKSTRYNTGGKISIDLNTETITFNAAGLYHIEGSFYTFFVDNSSHEVFVDAKINGEILEPLGYKATPANSVGFSPAGLQFHNDIYFAAGTTVQLTNRYGSMKNVRGFFSANFISQ